jgi:hypothetical protein
LNGTATHQIRKEGSPHEHNRPGKPERASRCRRSDRRGRRCHRRAATQSWGAGWGIAVDPFHIPLDSPALQALVRANNRALRTIAEQPDLAVDYIASFLNRLTRDEAQQYYERYIRSACPPTARWTSTSRSKGSARSRPNSA